MWIAAKTSWPGHGCWRNAGIHFGMGPRQGPDGTVFVGKTLGIAGEHLSGAQMAAALTQVLGQPVRYQAVSPEVYRTFGFPGGDDIGNMFQFKHDFNAAFCGARDPGGGACPASWVVDIRTVAGGEQGSHSVVLNRSPFTRSGKEASVVKMPSEMITTTQAK